MKRFLLVLILVGCYVSPLIAGGFPPPSSSSSGVTQAELTAGLATKEDNDSNDILVDRFLNDTTDDGLIPASLLNIQSMELIYDVPDNNLSHSGFANDCDGGCPAGSLMDVCDTVYIDSSGYMQLADGDATGPAWGVMVLSNSKSGTHTGSSGAATMTDSAATFVTDVYNGVAIVFNLTDGSSAIVTDNGTNTLVGTLSGGTENDWDFEDAYVVGLLAFLPRGYCRNDDRFSFSAAGVVLYLDDVAGGVAEYAGRPQTTGDVLQPIGRAKSADVGWFDISPTFGYGTVD